jgi:hypothetical protein
MHRGCCSKGGWPIKAGSWLAMAMALPAGATDCGALSGGADVADATDEGVVVLDVLSLQCFPALFRERAEFRFVCL